MRNSGAGQSPQSGCNKSSGPSLHPYSSHPGLSNWIVNNVVHVVLEHGGNSFWRGEGESSLDHVEFEILRSPAKSWILLS